MCQQNEQQSALILASDALCERAQRSIQLTDSVHEKVSYDAAVNIGELSESCFEYQLAEVGGSDGA